MDFYTKIISQLFPYCHGLILFMGFAGGLDGKESAMLETQVLSLGQEDLLEKFMNGADFL